MVWVEAVDMIAEEEAACGDGHGSEGDGAVFDDEVLAWLGEAGGDLFEDEAEVADHFGGDGGGAEYGGRGG